MRAKIAAILLGLFVISGCSIKEHRMQNIRSQYPNWDQDTIEKVAARHVEVGMTQEMVVAALGKPHEITHEGDEEKWAYTEMVYNGWDVRIRNVYFVYFKDAKVTRAIDLRNVPRHRSMK